MKKVSRVYTYNTKYKDGFTHSEIEKLLEEYPGINVEKFYDQLKGITCIVIDGETVIYHCDIITALRCGIENRDMYSWEFD